jgi:hypothetical protein
MIPDPPDDGATEFVCSDCSRYIIQICGPPPGSRFGLCAACLTIPGWYSVPELRELIDPEGAGHVGP